MDMHAPITISTRFELFTRKNSEILDRSLAGIIKQMKKSVFPENHNSSDASLLSVSGHNGNGATAESMPSPLYKVNGSAKKNSIRVLHIEDDEEIRFLVKAFLKNFMEVDSVADGDEALSHTSENKYDLIITDINLGSGIDGIEATREIRNMLYYRNVPVIAVTANAGSDIRNKCIEVGMDAFLLKPFMKNDLISTIEQVIGDKQ